MLREISRKRLKKIILYYRRCFEINNNIPIKYDLDPDRKYYMVSYYLARCFEENHRQKAHARSHNYLPTPDGT